MNNKRSEQNRGEAANEATKALKKKKKKFSSEENCMDYLIKSLLKNGRCRACNSTNVKRLEKSRDYICNDCGYRSSVTAGTAFDGIRKVAPHLKLIWLLEKGIAFNCSQVHRQLGIAYSTCWTICKKLSMVIMNDFGKRNLSRFGTRILSRSFCIGISF